MARPSAGSAFSGLTIEGNLLAPAILKLVADRKATDQSDNDYDLPRGVTLRDEVVVLGPQEGRFGKDVITADEVADHAGTIAWEVLTSVSRRVPRFYREP